MELQISWGTLKHATSLNNFYPIEFEPEQARSTLHTYLIHIANHTLWYGHVGTHILATYTISNRPYTCENIFRSTI